MVMDGVLIGLVVGFAALGALFWTLEALWPAIRGKRIARQGFRTDLVYWLFTPLVSGNITRVGVALFVGAAVLLLGAEASPQGIRRWIETRQGFVTHWPLWLQGLVALTLLDFSGYLLHRLFHRGWFWRVHAVHHSSRDLDWLSSVRLHPLNELITRAVQVLPLLLLGFDLRVLAGVAPLLTLYAIFLHANLRWDFGPLRYVIATPRFHRWHHTSQNEGLDKNFAGFFPLWDIMFGTFYMPRGRQPEVFGVAGEAVPEGIVGQMLYPFRRKPATAQASQV